MSPKHITVHCSATQNLPKYDAAWIKAEHHKRGWSDIGYHYVIKTDGTIQNGRPINKTGAHVKGHNRDNVGICLIGGVNDKGWPVNNYTQEQLESLAWLIKNLMGTYGIQDVKGHRDWFGDTNGDGVIDSRDWQKVCPCFDVQAWIKSWDD